METVAELTFQGLRKGWGVYDCSGPGHTSTMDHVLWIISSNTQKKKRERNKHAFVYNLTFRKSPWLTLCWSGISWLIYRPISKNTSLALNLTITNDFFKYIFCFPNPQIKYSSAVSQVNTFQNESNQKYAHILLPRHKDILSPLYWIPLWKKYYISIINNFFFRWAKSGNTVLKMCFKTTK